MGEKGMREGGKARKGCRKEGKKRERGGFVEQERSREWKRRKEKESWRAVGEGAGSAGRAPAPPGVSSELCLPPAHPVLLTGTSPAPCPAPAEPGNSSLWDSLLCAGNLGTGVRAWAALCFPGRSWETGTEEF